MKKIVIIDGQGGRLGRMLAEEIRERELSCELIVIGTNSIATANMLKAGADAGATGENPVIVACRDADFILGPVGILSADALMGEVTPAMAAAVGRSAATKLLLPVNMCATRIVGVKGLSFSELVSAAAAELEAQL